MYFVFLISFFQAKVAAIHILNTLKYNIYNIYINNNIKDQLIYSEASQEKQPHSLPYYYDDLQLSIGRDSFVEYPIPRLHRSNKFTTFRLFSVITFKIMKMWMKGCVSLCVCWGIRVCNEA